MTNPKHSTAARMAASLSKAEHTVDESIKAAALLIETLISVRVDAGLPFGSNMSAMRTAAEAVSQQIQARLNICRTHAQALEAGVKHGVVAEGDIVPTFDDKPRRSSLVA